MKPILPSRPNHSWLRRRFLGPAIPGSPRSPEVTTLHGQVVLPIRRYAGASPRPDRLPSSRRTGSTHMNELDLKGKKAVVTGGAAGIGLAIAQRLAKSGARLSLWDRDEKALADAAKALG